MYLISHDTMTPEVQMALGRMFRMMSRPTAVGDVAMYAAIRSLLLDAAEGRIDGSSHAPNYVRERLSGAQGDHA